MSQTHCDPDIPSEVIEDLRKALCARATARAPAGTDPIEFGKDLAQQAHLEAWRWLITRESQTEEEFKIRAHWVLNKRLGDEYRQTKKRQATQSIQALEEDVGIDSLLALTADEPLPYEILNCADIVGLVSRVLAKLSDDDYTILKLRHLHDMNNAQIAQALAIAERTIPRRYPKAVKAFKSAWRFLTNDMNY